MLIPRTILIHIDIISNSERTYLVGLAQVMLNHFGKSTNISESVAIPKLFAVGDNLFYEGTLYFLLTLIQSRLLIYMALCK